MTLNNALRSGAAALGVCALAAMSAPRAVAHDTINIAVGVNRSAVGQGRGDTPGPWLKERQGRRNDGQRLLRMAGEGECLYEPRR